MWRAVWSEKDVFAGRDGVEGEGGGAVVGERDYSRGGTVESPLAALAGWLPSRLIPQCDRSRGELAAGQGL